MTTHEMNALKELLEPINKKLDTLQGHVTTLEGQVIALQEDVTHIKKEVSGHTALLEHVYHNAVTKEEHNGLKERVNKLEAI